MIIIEPYKSCFVRNKAELEEAVSQNYREIYSLTSAGLYKVHRLNETGTRFVQIRVSAIPNVKKDAKGVIENPELDILPSPEGGNIIQLLPDGKVPFVLFYQIVELFREVMRRNNNRSLEAMAWVIWSEEEGYRIHVPKQQVSAGSVQYDWDVPLGSFVVIDMHSHNSMNAFFSGTDNADDRLGARYSGVIGKLSATSDSYEQVWRSCYNGIFNDVKFQDIWGPFGNREQAEDLLSKIQTYSYTNTMGGYHGSYPMSSTHGGARGGRTNSGNGVGRSTAYDLTGEDYWSDYTRAAVDPSPNSNVRRIPDQRSNANVSPLPNQNTAVPPTRIVGADGKPVLSDLEREKQLQEQLARLRSTQENPRGNVVSDTAEKVPEKELVVSARAVLPNQSGKQEPLALESPEVGSTPEVGELSEEEELRIRQFAMGMGDGLDEENLDQELFGNLIRGLMEPEEFEESIPDMSDHPRYEILEGLYGPTEANNFLVTSMLTSFMKEEDLLVETMTDIFQMIGEEAQLKAFRSMYELLSPKNQQSINTGGV